MVEASSTSGRFLGGRRHPPGILSLWSCDVKEPRSFLNLSYKMAKCRNSLLAGERAGCMFQQIQFTKIGSCNSFLEQIAPKFSIAQRILQPNPQRKEYWQENHQVITPLWIHPFENLDSKFSWKNPVFYHLIFLPPGWCLCWIPFPKNSSPPPKKNTFR